MTNNNAFCFGIEISGHRAPTAFKTRKIETKNHFAENFKKLRQMQKSNKNQIDSSKQPVKALWKSSKYEKVESKLKDQLQNMFGESAQSNTRRNFLRAHSRTGIYSASARSPSPAPSTSDMNAGQDRPASAVDTKSMKNVDYIKLNGRAIKNCPLRRSSSLVQLNATKQPESIAHFPGKIPQYLLERKNQWMKDEEEIKKKKAQAEIPAGHRLMTEEERRGTLEKVKQKHTELSQQLGSLPLRNDTVRIRTVKGELERKIIEIEEAMKKLSQPKVYVDLKS